MKYVIIFLFCFSSVMAQVPDNPGTQTFVSIAHMTARAGNIGGFRVTLLGFYAAGDGGGGIFYWDATSVASVIPGIVIKPTAVTTGRWIRLYHLDYVSVLWFGAKCDGTTDDYSAVQAALTIGGNVNFPFNKTCLVNTPLVYSQSYTNVIENGTKVICGSSSTFSQGIFSTNNTTAAFTDNSPTITVTSGQNWFRYSGHASISVGQIVQLSGATINGNYHVGILGIISRISSDTIFTSIASDTTFSPTSLNAYTKLTKISISGGAISANNNTNAFGVAFFGCSECTISKIAYSGTGSQVGLELLSSFNSSVSQCSVDSCTNTTNSLGYGISTNGQNNTLDHNTVSNCKHNLTSGANTYTSNNIVYSDDVCNSYSYLNTINIDMHALVRGSIIRCTVNTSSTTGIQIRGKGQNILDCTVNIDNSIFGNTTIKGLDALELYGGYSEIARNTVNIIHGSGTNFFGLDIEGGIYPNAPYVNIHNNNFNNAGLLVLSQNMDRPQILDNVFAADTLTFNGVNASGLLTNFIFKGNLFYNRTVSGSTYAINLNNSSQTPGDISFNNFYQWHQTGSLIKLSTTTTGTDIYHNYVYSTLTNPFSDASTGQQNPMWDNEKIDSLGNWTAVAYATTPTASSIYEGKYIMVVSGSTTVANVCTKTGSGTWSFHTL